MNLRLIAETLQRQRIIFVSVLIAGLALYIVALPLARKFTATSTLLAAAAPSNSSSVLDPQKDPITSSVGLKDLENLATSSTILGRVSRNLHLSSDESKALIVNVKAKGLFDSDVLPVQVSNRDANLAVAEVNALATELAAYATSISTSRYDQLISDLGRQVSERREKLRQIDRQVQGLASTNFYLTADGDTSPINIRLIALETQAQQLKATVDGDAANARVFEKRPGLSRHLASHEIKAQDPSFVALQTQYGKDLAALNNMKGGYTDGYPGIAGLQQVVSRERTSMTNIGVEEVKDPTQSATYVAGLLDSNRAEATLTADRAQLATVNKELAELNLQLTQSGSQGNRIADLRRERAADQDAFTQLSGRLDVAVADRSQAASIGSVVVIDRAASAPPSLLGKPGVLASAFAIAFIWLAISLSFVADGLDKRLRSRASIEDLYGKPVFNSVG